MTLTGFRLIVLICAFSCTALYVTAYQTASRDAALLAVASEASLLTAAAPPAAAVEDAAQERPREIEAVIVDAVRQTSADMPLQGNVEAAQDTAGLAQRLDGNDVVAVAVNQENGGARSDVGGQVLGAGHQAGKAHNASNRPGAAKPHVKRHHRALTKADKRKRLVLKAKARKLLVQKRIKRRRRVAHAAPPLTGIAKR